MNTEVVEAILLAAIFAVLVVVVERFYRTVIRRWWTIFTSMTEIVIYPRSSPAQKELLRTLFQTAESGDEIMFAARTYYGLLSEDENVTAILKALEHGVILKLLFLNGKKLTESQVGQQIDLRFLRIHDAFGRLVHDVGITEAKLGGVRQKCSEGKFAGSLLVYRTDFVIQNSIVVHVRNKHRGSNASQKVPKNFLYDFSFGEDESDKFTQFYKPHRKQQPSDFFSRLYEFYDAMFDPDASSFDFGLSYRPSKDTLQTELCRMALDRWKGFIEGHTESEAVRDNALVKILPSAAQVFSALRHNHPVPAPITVQIELTNVCSTKCAHCFRWSTTAVRQMSTELAKSLLTQLSDFGVRTITFSGGEPTQHSQFIELLTYASERKLGIGVLSNGVGITEQALKAIHTHAQWFRISMDGSNRTVYQEVRSSLPGQNAFDEVMITLQRFKQLNDKAQRCRLSICYTIQKKNAHNVGDMIRMVRTQGLPGGDKSLTFKFAHGKDGAGAFLCDEAQIRKLQKLFVNPEFQHAANLDYLQWFLEHQSSARDIIAGRPAESLYRNQETRCFTPHLFGLVDPSGDIFPCCFLYEDNSSYAAAIQARRRKHCLGSLKTKNFIEIWRGAEYQQLRDELAVINPSGNYGSCGECTRHCNHNKWFSKLHQEYNALYAAGGNSDQVMQTMMSALFGDTYVRDVWL